MDNQQPNKRNTTMKVAGYILVFLSILLICGFGIRLSYIVQDTGIGSRFDHTFRVLLLVGHGVSGLLFIMTGRYFLRYSKRSDIPELHKEFVVCNFVNSLLGIPLSATVLTVLAQADWSRRGEWSDDIVGATMIVSFALSGLLHLIALALTVKKKVYPSYLLMIVGGIIVLPIGILSILAGVRLRKYTQGSEVCDSQDNYENHGLLDSKDNNENCEVSGNVGEEGGHAQREVFDELSNSPISINRLFGGPISRGQFATFYITIVIVNAVFFSLAYVDTSIMSTLRPITKVGAILFPVTLLVVAVKRLYDLGRSGFHSLLFLVPIYNLYLLFELLFRKGERKQQIFHYCGSCSKHIWLREIYLGIIACPDCTTKLLTK